VGILLHLILPQGSSKNQEAEEQEGLQKPATDLV
jgi:hypothetical protein